MRKTICQFNTYYIIREHSNFINQLLTSSVQPLQQNARCKLIDNAPVQRARKLLEGPNRLKGLIGQSPKHPVTPALRAHTTACRSRGLQISVQLKHTLTPSLKSRFMYE